LAAANLKRAGSADRAEDAALDRFAGGIVRHALYGIREAGRDADLRSALNWFHANLPDYWHRQRTLIGVLQYLGQCRSAARGAEAEVAARLLAPCTMTACGGWRRMAVRRLSSRRQPLDRSFLNNRRTGAASYDRIAGYFRSSVFEIAGEAYEQSRGGFGSSATPGSTRATSRRRAPRNGRSGRNGMRATRADDRGAAATL
jgi:hypothetical protein